MLKELATSFKAILYDRIVSPLSGAFLLSWIIFNWKILALIFLGKTPIIERISYIESNYINIDSIIINPAISTAIIVFIYPWISNVAYIVWQKSLSFKIQTRIKYENSTPLTVEQSVELRKEIQKKDIEFNELLSAKNQKILDQKDTITYLNETINEKDKNTSSLTKILKDKEKIIDNINNQNIIKNNTSDPNGSTYVDNTQEWHNEYSQRTRKGAFIHDYFGQLLDVTLGSSDHPLENEALRYFTSAGIADLDEHTGKLYLTEKGKYFANLWSIEE